MAFYMMDGQLSMSAVLIEALKLALQFFGALFIAWRAVRWALRRYKDEKHWERKLNAYSELTTALGTLLSVVAEWEDQQLTHRGPRGTTEEDLRNSYWSARRKLEEAHSTAMLLLPTKVASLVDGLLKNLAKNDDNDHPHFMDKINEEWSLVGNARNEIIEIGKFDLQLDVGSPRLN
ncbi:hypothetical protein [Mesorhizobium retamae]|uniref:SMODS and SLOG-associating 2TM effector domain-containing protein n=1 Tax=Mesorhizobium retamae TaxID=2912854 RepID=A0ABS9QM49_9HYPH|nr:hypothetical protein [Mesorhizobium sp. IRAMC:0171]MCG7508520.1 hypothetical protein [Mesorhizobium sp. IRAMC:0171]